MFFGIPEKWTKIMLGSQSPKTEHKFNNTKGLAFHKDRLIVCDKGNNIVQILNQEYARENVLGSFSGRFAKPFQPQSVAVSQDNLYFILDDSNLQIVVCDQRNEISSIITLPHDTKPWCIALVKTYVLVTDVNGHRLLMYSLDGQYIAKVGSQHGRSQFSYPYFVAVNSQDAIMVSDSFNHCIKCFDIDLKYKYKYGSLGKGDGQLRWARDIDLDQDDNVYLCDSENDRIVKWSSDGKWICNLFKRDISHPQYIAVTATGDRIAIGWGGNEIAVFSKVPDPPT
ncbi:tripartite motif-containing protein 3-like [Ptychodera flava]|uniref:tripartite motif-containing protein 3-like n=1 Tax=Ptychodera flava TaxID=63121 RepID=UPI003969DC14